MFSPKPSLLVFIFLLMCCCVEKGLAQQEIVPLPLDKLNRDSLNKIIQLAEKSNDYKMLGEIYGGVYNYYFLYSDKTDSAINYAVKAEENTFKAGDSGRYYFIQMQLGDYNLSIDFENAKKYYTNALQYYKRSNNYVMQANALGGLSYLHGLYKDTSAMIGFLKQTERVVKISGDTFNIVGINDRKAHLLIPAGKLDSAIYLISENLRLINTASRFGNSEAIRIFWKGLQLNLIADCYYRKNEYAAAIKYLKEGGQYDDKNAFLDAQNIIRYQLLVNSYIRSNQTDSAVKYNGVLQKQMLQAIARMNPAKLKEIAAKYETQKKQSQIEALQLQNRSQQLKVSSQRKINIALISISILSLLSALLIVKNIRQKRKLQLIAEHQKAEIEKTRAVETERYRISTELHDDIGSGLSTIRLLSEIMKEKNANGFEVQLNKISDSSKELVQKMNEIVWALNVNNDNLQSLVAYIRQYAVKALDDAGISCYFDITPVIPEYIIPGNERRNIFLMVKECVHNIIKHSKATEVIIGIEVGEHLSINIADNGIGFTNHENTVNHFGLNNLKQRAKALNGTIEWQQNNGTTVYIKIPLADALHKSVNA